ncbi:MAG: hypothetical protein AAF982_12815 [Pseudomonadota bacterium]
MRAPALTILQLDTRFPRIPGDIGCPDTFLEAVEVIKVPGARVDRIVTDDPARIDIGPFEKALARARGAIVATSCGFLSFWQDHLQKRTDRPLFSSSLMLLPRLAGRVKPANTVILTFDADRLTCGHLQGQDAFRRSVLGLGPDSHLRRIIEADRFDLDARAGLRDVIGTLGRETRRRDVRLCLMECTNLPPYAAALEREFGFPVFSILDLLEEARPGLVKPRHISRQSLGWFE